MEYNAEWICPWCSKSLSGKLKFEPLYAFADVDEDWFADPTCPCCHKRFGVYLHRDFYECSSSTGYEKIVGYRFSKITRRWYKCDYRNTSTIDWQQWFADPASKG